MGTGGKDTEEPGLSRLEEAVVAFLGQLTRRTTA